MAVTHEIGFPIDISKGIFSNTELIDGKLSLKSTGMTNSGEPLYEESGTWYSEAIDLVGRYTSLQNLAISRIVNGNSSFEAFTRTSEDNTNWDEYVPINHETGKIQSVPRRYIQVRIDFVGGKADRTEVMYEFDKKDDFEENEFVEFDGDLKLKRNYIYDMVEDNSWSEEGTLFRKTINRSNFKKIDSIVFSE